MSATTVAELLPFPSGVDACCDANALKSFTLSYTDPSASSTEK